MKLSIHLLLDLLEAELTEERCDAVALKVSRFVSNKGGPIGKLAGGIVYGALDAATPGALFVALHAVFPAEHTVALANTAAVGDAP